MAIKVDLPIRDSAGVKKTCQFLQFTLQEDQTIKISKLVEFVNDDGTPYVPANDLEKRKYIPTQINSTTDGVMVDPVTGAVVDHNTPGAITEMDWYKNVPIEAIPEESRQTAWGVIKWLVEQSLIQGNLSGKY